MTSPQGKLELAVEHLIDVHTAAVEVARNERAAAQDTADSRLDEAATEARKALWAAVRGLPEMAPAADGGEAPF